MRILVHGATGRMGRSVIVQAAHDPHIVLAAAVTRGGHPLLGLDAGEQAGCGQAGVALSDRDAAAEDIDAIIDFSTAAAFGDALALASDLQAALVSGTTGLQAEQLAALDDLSQQLPVLWAPNMSVAMSVMQQLVATAAAALPQADVEIVESHHRGKIDAPSGSAWGLAGAIAKARGQSVREVAQPQRTSQQQARKAGEIGMAALRGGTVAGVHRVFFELDGETLELAHQAQDRDIFARGALRAAHWLIAQPAGRYQLHQVVS